MVKTIIVPLVNGKITDKEIRQMRLEIRENVGYKAESLPMVANGKLIQEVIKVSEPENSETALDIFCQQ